MNKDKCFYCDDTGYIKGKKGKKGKEVVPGSKLSDQMCPHCEIGQAVIKGFNKATSIQLGNYEEIKAQRDQLLEACQFALDNFDKSYSEKAEAKARLQAAINLAKPKG